MARLQVQGMPTGRDRAGLERVAQSRSQLVVNVAGLLAVLCGWVLGPVAFSLYPLLNTERASYLWILGGVMLGILVWLTLALWGRLSWMTGRAVRLAAFVCGLGVAFLPYGLFGIANGYATPLVVRDVPVVAKQQTKQANPNQREYYVTTRPWPGSRAVAQVTVSRAVYEQLAVPVTTTRTRHETHEAMPDAAHVRLTLGAGRLGVDWVHGVSLP
jgi:hypothetical protein